MKKVLVIATAGLRPDQMDESANGWHPRVDYVELSRYLDIRVLDYSVYQHSRLGRLFRHFETQVRSDLYLTWLAWLTHKNYDLVFSMSERVGIPYAGLRRLGSRQGPFLNMFQSWSERQEFVIKRLGLLSKMTGIAVHCRSMKEHLINLGASRASIHTLPYTTDQKFFSPIDDLDQSRSLILSVGETRTRDYATLVSAVENLPVKLVAAASGPWYAREKNRELKLSVPANVELVQYLPRADLRRLYAQASFVAVPVVNQVSSAGVTTVMEAGCMERAVIVTCSKGILDYVVDGETGILVEPGNPQAMKEAMLYLLAHPEEARRMGKNARERIEAHFTLENYVEKMAQFIEHNL